MRLNMPRDYTKRQHINESTQKVRASNRDTALLSGVRLSFDFVPYSMLLEAASTGKWSEGRK